MQKPAADTSRFARAIVRRWTPSIWRGSPPARRTTGAPGLRPDYGPTYYAAFLTDFDGNNVEAVCMR